MAAALLEPVGGPMKIGEEKAAEAVIVPPQVNGNGGERIGRIG
jgi:hypothetical protein